MGKFLRFVLVVTPVILIFGWKGLARIEYTEAVLVLLVAIAGAIFCPLGGLARHLKDPQPKKVKPLRPLPKGTTPTATRMPARRFVRRSTPSARRLKIKTNLMPSPAATSPLG